MQRMGIESILRVCIKLAMVMQCYTHKKMLAHLSCCETDRSSSSPHSSAPPGSNYCSSSPSGTEIAPEVACPPSCLSASPTGTHLRIQTFKLVNIALQSRAYVAQSDDSSGSREGVPRRPCPSLPAM